MKTRHARSRNHRCGASKVAQKSESNAMKFNCLIMLPHFSQTKQALRVMGRAGMGDRSEMLSRALLLSLSMLPKVVNRQNWTLVTSRKLSRQLTLLMITFNAQRMDSLARTLLEMIWWGQTPTVPQQGVHQYDNTPRLPFHRSPKPQVSVPYPQQNLQPMGFPQRFQWWMHSQRNTSQHQATSNPYSLIYNPITYINSNRMLIRPAPRPSNGPPRTPRIPLSCNHLYSNSQATPHSKLVFN